MVSKRTATCDLIPLGIRVPQMACSSLQIREIPVLERMGYA